MLKRNTKLNRKCSKCRKQIDDRSKSGLCIKCCRLGNLNPFYNRKHTIKTRQHMKEKAKQRDNSTYHRIIQTAKMRKNHRNFMKERWKNVSKKDKEAMIKNWVIKGLESCKKSSKTKIENIMYRTLKQLKFKNIERNVQISYYNVDFLIDNLIIECFGDYWHCNPLIFDKNKYNKSLKLQASEKWNKDSKRLNRLKQMGYSCLYFWEHDIKNNIRDIKKILKKYARI